ncbi:PLP-dependent aspartate aminotransferase family protein [Helicobacter canis]|uniref:Cystathionine gamma-synthase n=1 Tax=Helicobacter canis TaxID=29419 RepID=A0A377J6F5_9HELI|nr:PLP-dependent aspartate aminotransferase family protein [Helicobacter canis]STO97948.1 cystathionine gamma-synthase [Helicobacter canis]
MQSSFDTTLIHGGLTTDPRTGAVNTPIFQTSTYAQDELGKHKGYEYSRTKNPTRDGIESLIAECEGGKYGFAFASGMAALGTILSLFKSGDCLIISQNVYGGTFRILDKVFNNFGIVYKIVDTRDLDALNAALTSEVKAVLIESPANPLLSVTPLAKVAQLCRQKGVLSIVDNTFMTPYLQQPLKLGIDIVVHSATKYLGGHSDLVAGLVVVDDESLAERIGFLQNSIGGVLAPFDSFLLIRGMKTLGLRMQRHCENALFLAEALSEHKAVEKVYYPGLKSDSEYEVQSSQARGGGGMLSFILKPEYDYRIFFKSTRIIVLAESLGGVESLLCHPASMTHASIPKDLRESMGIAENLIRLSVGIEYGKDLLEDIHQAIEKSRAQYALILDSSHLLLDSF